MGTPDFAAVILKALAQWPRGEIVAVYTQPDRPAGRGHKLTPSPVKRLAQELDLPVLQPQSLKNAEAQAELSALQADQLNQWLDFSNRFCGYSVQRYGAIDSYPTIDQL